MYNVNRLKKKELYLQHKLQHYSKEEIAFGYRWCSKRCWKKLHIYGYKNNESIFIAEIFYIWALATIKCYKNQVAWGQTSLKKTIEVYNLL